MEEKREEDEIDSELTKNQRQWEQSKAAGRMEDRRRIAKEHGRAGRSKQCKQRREEGATTPGRARFKRRKYEMISTGLGKKLEGFGINAKLE